MPLAAVGPFVGSGRIHQIESHLQAAGSVAAVAVGRGHFQTNYYPVAAAVDPAALLLQIVTCPALVEIAVGHQSYSRIGRFAVELLYCIVHTNS